MAGLLLLLYTMGTCIAGMATSETTPEGRPMSWMMTIEPELIGGGARLSVTNRINVRGFGGKRVLGDG